MVPGELEIVASTLDLTRHGEVVTQHGGCFLKAPSRRCLQAPGCPGVETSALVAQQALVNGILDKGMPEAVRGLPATAPSTTRPLALNAEIAPATWSPRSETFASAPRENSCPSTEAAVIASRWAGSRRSTRERTRRSRASGTCPGAPEVETPSPRFISDQSTPSPTTRQAAPLGTTGYPRPPRQRTLRSRPGPRRPTAPVPSP